MQYLVQTSGDTIERRTKAYAIKASSKTEAMEIAKNNFEEDHFVIDAGVSVKLYARTQKAILAMGLMCVPILLSFINWKVGHDTISIQPSYVSCLYAVAFYAAYVLRFKGLDRAIESWIDIVFCILNVLLLSSFIQTVMVSKHINLLGIKEIAIDTKIILPIALLLSWLGLKFVSVLCMCLIMVLAVFNISELSTAMGSINGSAYIICGAIGLLLYMSIEPATYDALPHMRSVAYKGAKYLKSDVDEVEKSIRSMKENVQINRVEHDKKNTEEKSGKDI